MKWEPSCLHLYMNNDVKERMCGAPSRTWPEHCMNDKWARKLPICEDCMVEYKRKTGRDYKSTPTPRETHRVEQAGGLFLSDYRAFGYKGTTKEQ